MSEILWINRNFNLNFVPREISHFSSGFAGVVEAIGYRILPVGIAPIVESNSEIAGIAGEDFCVVGIKKVPRIFICGAEPSVQIVHRIAGRNIVAVEVVTGIGEAIDIGGVCGGDVVAENSKVLWATPRGFPSGKTKKYEADG